jgi:hypothetical protein
VPPEVVKLIVLPSQTGVFEEATPVGKLFTFAVTEDTTVQPLESVTVTLYTPFAVFVAAAILGFWLVLVKAFTPVQL